MSPKHLVSWYRRHPATMALLLALISGVLFVLNAPYGAASALVFLSISPLPTESPLPTPDATLPPMPPTPPATMIPPRRTPTPPGTPIYVPLIKNYSPRYVFLPVIFVRS